MKKVLILAALFCFAVPGLIAQEHVTLGVFGDYTRLGAINTNFYGLGGRIGFNAGRHFALEGETAYDFDQSYGGLLAGIPGNGGGLPYRTSVHLWSGLFGPKFESGGPIKLFVVAKGGFLNFAGGNPTFANQVGQFGSNSTYGVFYPGGGIEGHLGPIGLRLDVGDEIYFNNGANNNLKVQVGPYFRF